VTAGGAEGPGTDGAPGEPQGAAVGEAGPGRSRLPVDGGAVFAGWVGLGVALVIAISLELIVAVQALVFLIAPLAGVLVGAYANQRSERWRPAGRVLANAVWAGVVTGIGMAVLYASLRLLFVFADSGFRPGQGGQLDCQTGPECTWMRYVAEGQGETLAAAGVVDGATFGEFFVREQLVGGLTLLAFTLAGALRAGVVRATRTPPPTAVAAASQPGTAGPASMGPREG
jgi:hypothetical protein